MTSASARGYLQKKIELRCGNLWKKVEEGAKSDVKFFTGRHLRSLPKETAHGDMTLYLAPATRRLLSQIPITVGATHS